ncbi:MAG: hypothetical protein M1832_005791 [Thelocarpon impressellum]|nr:MAG: hypothetical protein M1832_005791 [Thelocarpon impressellum]
MASSSHDQSAGKERAGLVPSHGITIDVPPSAVNARPALVKHTSSPVYQSPIRHHRRNASTPRQVKETLNARSEYTNSEDDGPAMHRINQYIIKQEIGRGSFGAVHLAVDQYGTEYAVKEFSKSRLRKRAQSHILRRPRGMNIRRPGHLGAGFDFNSPLHRRSVSEIHDQEEGGNPLYLIREEIAIMKKLNHDNLVCLFEVLDDPAEDSLYMVLEMCKKGVIMKVGMDEKADPYDAESCRHWFRDLILGIEYLHAQGIVHRDIKPDNLLLTHDDMLKIVDFGVSEMFEKESEMLTAKSAGSPAFLPPELCVAKHGDISGKAADIWSMGVTLYCLRFGKIPFEKPGVLDLYEAIRNDSLTFEEETEPEFVDVLMKLLEKDPQKRIKMAELRAHPWVTKHGTDPLLSAEENTAELVEPPTEAEMQSAITGNFLQLLTVMRAVRRFKDLASRKRPRLMEGILGRGDRMVQPPLTMTQPVKHDAGGRMKSLDLHDRAPVEGALASEGVHRDINVDDLRDSLPHRKSSLGVPPQTDTKGSVEDRKDDGKRTPTSSHAVDMPRRGANAHHQDSGKGHAHDPTDEELLVLGIGAGAAEAEGARSDVLSESPSAAEMNIYETAYREEVDRIHEAQGRQATVYSTRRVDEIKGKLEEKGILGGDEGQDRPKVGWAKILAKTKDKAVVELEELVEVEVELVEVELVEVELVEVELVEVELVEVELVEVELGLVELVEVKVEMGVEWRGGGAGAESGRYRGGYLIL